MAAWKTATVLTLPYLPQIVSECTAIIPLVCHLASYKQDYELVGQLALTQRLPVDIFPRLGVLYGLSKLLQRSTEYIDRASTKGAESWTVWDVRWGSIFPCANGGASSMIIQHVVGTQITTMPDTLPESFPKDAASTISPSGSDSSVPQADRAVRTDEKASATVSNQRGKVPSTTPPRQHTAKSSSSGQGNLSGGYRRMQTLHVLQFDRANPRVSWLGRVDAVLDSFLGQCLSNLCLLCATAALFAFGLYGSAVVIACGCIARFACKLATIERPSGYLQNNEADKDTFMLVGLHQNTSDWYLFAGDRGIVDSLLNKPMVVVLPSRWNETLAWILRCSHAVQLVAMIFVAGQKGWDGIALVIIMALNVLSRWRWTDGLIVKRWMDVEGIDVHARSFDFTGRTMMLGAIQEFSQSDCESWMDGIVSPHRRRDAWLARLRALAKEQSPGRDEALNNTSDWSPHDWRSILLSSGLAHEAAKVLKKEFVKEASA
jgi:hypothetical protein